MNDIEIISNCLFCGSNDSSGHVEGVRDFFFHADMDQFTYRWCKECGSIWLENRPLGERLLKAYATYHTHGEPQHHTPGKGLRAALRLAYIKSRFARADGTAYAVFSRALGRLLPDNWGINRQFRFAPPAPAKLLDYGCGNGEYLLWMSSLGYTLTGAEYDPHLLTTLAGSGIALTDVRSIDAETWQDEFDHITLSHVLEHVPDPLELLDRLYKFLKPGGTLFLELPNGKATGLQIFGPYWRGLEAPRHFALPSSEALANNLRRAGFENIHQHIDTNARRWMWQESLEVCPENEREARLTAMGQAPVETQANAELLTFTARKPHPR